MTMLGEMDILRVFALLIFSMNVMIEVQGYRNRAPYFTNTWTWKVRETDTVGSSPVSGLLSDSSDTVVLKAYDPEGDKLTFRVKGDIGSKYFTVDESTGVVKVQKQFDYEVDSRYTAKFTVSDGQNTVEGEAKISIIDANDNAPTFDRFPYNFTVPEDANIGQEVGRIRATDPDTGFGGSVSYFFSNEYEGPFTLDRDSGALRVRELLDYERIQSYSFYVIAKDQDIINPLSSIVQVIIPVKDVQDTDPVFNNLPYDVTILENTKRGTEVTCIKAADGDKGSPNRVVYSMVAGNEAGDFILDSASGKLRVARTIDRDIPAFDGVYQLTVRATELPTKGSRGGAFSETSFRVTVADVDDQLPTWNWQAFRTTLSETTPLGTRLPITMHVKDLDQGINSEMTISVDEKHSRFFAPSPSLVQGSSDVAIVLIQTLDFELTDTMTFKVIANETLSPKRSSACEVIVEVINVNDEKPTFDKAVYSVNVPENVTLDTDILRVSAYDSDKGVFGEVSYSMEDSSRKFDIDENTGQIFVVAEVDREGVFQYSIPITARDGGSPPMTSTSIVIIHIDDVNDNAPLFDAKSYFVTINENVVPKTALALVRASDADHLPTNKDVTYSIAQSAFAHKFTISKAQNGEGVVRLIEPLDFENITDGRVELTLVAMDNGRPRLNSTASLVVTVTDVNDNAPKFNADSTFVLNIREDVGGGVSVGHVSASDKDFGANARIRYYSSGGEFDDVFRLDSQTGDITIKPGASADHETMPYYDVTVTAIDDGSPPLSTNRKLMIKIIDINDNPPSFNQSQYEITMEEGVAGIVTQVTATDRDGGDFGRIVYEISEGNSDQIFEINRYSGLIKARKPLDFESSNGVYSLTVAAKDSPSQPKFQLVSYTEVIVKITDVNDNAPIFDGDRTHVTYSIVEAVEGSRVAKFTAKDQDGGKNGEVWFYIAGGDEKKLFEISHSEGVLRVKSGKSLDREVDPYHHLAVGVSDKGDISLNSTMNVTIKVIDTNDNSPQFVEFEPVVGVKENATVGTLVTKFIATDPDLGNFGEIRYKISSGNYQDVFKIVSKTGALVLIKPLDRETTSSYSLQISAYDNPGSDQNSRIVSEQLKINVIDVNDGTPMFIGSTPYRARLDENSKVGTPIKMLDKEIKAVDTDEGENADIAFSIVSHDLALSVPPTASYQQEYFYIDRKSGQIFSQFSIDRENLVSDVIRIVIRASDVGGRHSDAIVLLHVDDVNDNAPEFASEVTTVHVREDVEPGSKIYKVRATDADLGTNGEVAYRLQKGGLDKFILESETGLIRLAPGRSLDREEMTSYQLTVIAYDQGTVTSRSSTATVVIEIDDVNDSKPKFETNSISVEVKENVLVGTLITKIEARDDDVSRDLAYSITSFNAFNDAGRQLVERTHKSRRKSRNADFNVIRSWFKLNSTTGEVTVASSNGNDERAIDREVCSMVEFEVSVIDLASEVENAAEGSETLSVQITILDENDNAPLFMMTSPDGEIGPSGSDVIIDIPEETAIGSILTTLRAEDPDTGSNGKVVYDVIEGRKVRMRDRESGILVVESRIDRESLSLDGGSAWVNITVLARDLGFPASKSTKLRLHLRVRDINDNTPKFDEKFYQISVFENVTIGSEVGMVTATDDDSGSYGDITYKLKGGKNKFQIHPKTGSVRVTSAIDREVTPELSFIVTATDNQRGAEADRRETSTQVVVIVNDVNDNEPAFYEPRFTQKYTVQESAKLDTFVAAVAAFDPDVGASATITYSLKKTRLASYFRINPSSGHISVGRRLSALRRPLKDDTLTVFATDGGGLRSNITLHLDIADVNDHAPEFIGDDWNETYVTEESRAGLFVTQLKARDQDDDLNGMIRFSFCDVTVKDDTRPFFLDEITGRIITSQRLDREQQAEYLLRVCAADLGEPRRQTMATIKVKVRDVNDNRPKFPQNEEAEGANQVINIAEDFPVGKVIGSVTKATDADVGENAEIHYHLVAVSGKGAERDLDAFAVRRNTGEVVLRTPLDREVKNRYVLIIGATNNGNVTLSLPVTSQYKIPAGIMTWDATAMTEPENLTDAVGILMMLSGSYGEVLPLPMQPVDRSVATFDPARDSSLLRLEIKIDDVNDEWPKFKKSKYTTAVDMNLKAGSEVIRVKAVDHDEGANGIVTYKITRTLLRTKDQISERLVTDIFEISSRGGVVYTSRDLRDFYDGYFILSLEARDNANHYSLSTLYIYILRKNEKVRFILDTPLHIVKAKQETLLEILGNVTGSLVVMDSLLYDITSEGLRDPHRTDVTIRAFNPVTLEEVVSEKLSKSLDENRREINQIFGDYDIKSVAQARNKQADDGAGGLQAVIISLINLIIILIIIFFALYARLRRKYKRKIEELRSLEYNDEIASSHGGSVAFWKGKLKRSREKKTSLVDSSKQEFSETDTIGDLSSHPVPAVRKIHHTTSESSSDVTPIVKLRSRSENDRLKMQGMSRTNTDVWVPRHGASKPHIVESYRRPRENPRPKRSSGKRSRKSAAKATYCPSEGADSAIDVTDSKTGLSGDSRPFTPQGEATVIATGHDMERPLDMNLHSGGNSGPTGRKSSLASQLRAADMSEQSSLKSGRDDDDMTSSVSSLNFISDI